ncbi:pentatricopeptide repeat-containing protein At4g32450, mitochondrial-like [Cynara cardunculus var. scolymus]|uniref:Pentatricopeptide repeat-containing protein n=1 Tax=Cynara cardunculus var. scolymus TaxID=59895 RepID=A0A103XFB3_CYNCS|nr:pentatricopeptide repeat-containing protein At4g32450, mitochondrial-like [Cynara cardunculus var. scolymus]KVH89624.1 Pentatricopeptide repeat-containing protein [Cynara cardunculus var. scolymus]
MSQARLKTSQTMKFVDYVYKVCSGSRSCSFNSVKILSFSTLNSAATDESFDFQNPNGYSPKSSSEYGDNWSFRESNRKFKENLTGIYRENSTGVQRNPSLVYGQSYNPGSLRNEFQSNPDGNSVNYNKNYEDNILQHGSNRLYEESRNMQSSRMNNGMYQESQGNYNNGENGVFGQSPYNTNSQNTRNFVPIASEGSGQRFDEKSVRINGFYIGNASSNQQNSSNLWNNSSRMDHQIQNEKSDESSEDGRLNGTIDEFDFFCKEKKLKEAVEVLGLLEQRNISVDISRYLFLMNECGEAQALEEAKYVYEHLSRSISHLDVRICNKIMEMYAKCGSMEDAYTVFNKMGQRNLTSWDTMITWLAKNGHGEDAIEMFTEFKKIGLKPDNQMFFGVFTACSVVGDMKEGMLHFESMIKNYNIEPSTDHYSSVVDMLGSAGYLTEALEFIDKMPIEPGVGIWEIMMNHSRVHGDTELGDRCAELVELLDPTRLDEQSKAGLIPIKSSDIAKEKEKKRFNPLEIKTKVYEYRAGDTSHPEHEKLYSQLRCLKQPMKEVGYVPETKFVLHDIDQESKEEALLSHSERLALSQALMTSPARSPIRIIKNLRVCGDCHNALKIISKLVGRLIVARDAKRFHHFENGVCSCGDYW